MKKNNKLQKKIHMQTNDTQGFDNYVGNTK